MQLNRISQTRGFNFLSKNFLKAFLDTYSVSGLLSTNCNHKSFRLTHSESSQAK